MKGRSRAEVTRWVELASLWEACAPKPGNVNRRFDFVDATLPDFLSSAAVAAEALRGLRTWRVGPMVHRAVRARRATVATNTNLGMLLLLAPLALAATKGPRGSLREETGLVLASLDGEDSRLVYEAIRLASPGGLGRSEKDDVAEKAPTSLIEAMKEAADRDAVAREYATDFSATFDIVLPGLRAALEGGSTLSQAIVEVFLSTLALIPDSLIARKEGIERARDVSRRAARLLDRCRRAPDPDALARFDGELRAFGNRLNPGATADLVAGALFALLAEGPWNEAQLLARWTSKGTATARRESPPPKVFRSFCPLPRGERTLSFPHGELPLGRRTLLMAIVNVTADSFHEASRVGTVDEALDRARAMVAQGADMIDIGGQSTRPGAPLVDEEEEMSRLLPVVRALRSALPGTILSVDTARSRVAARALADGADLVNDVTALDDPDMAAVVAEAGVPVVLMHGRGRAIPEGESDPLPFVAAFLAERVGRALDAGIARDRILIDPGIGFGKRRSQSRALLGRIDELRSWGFPLLIGHSRKALVGDGGPEGRLEETLAVTALCAEKGVDILRVHDVAANARVLRTLAAIKKEGDS
ncbi:MULTISPECIES: dihydropteroate synthase [Synergistales]|nr:dihydropteroate synthase [Aminithiophilus ramosus]